MATNQNDWWTTEFLPAAGKVDYLSRDGKTAIEVQRAAYGSRGLYSAVMQLSLYLERNAAVERACLVLTHTRMSFTRLQDEWQAAKRVLLSPIAQRLGLIVIDNQKTWVDPDEAYLRRIARALEVAECGGSEARDSASRGPPGRKAHEVLKVLLSRWLQQQGPIAIGELAAEVGCSYPTVRRALDNPSLRGALQFTSSRSVELAAFPHDAWRELLALSRTQRNTQRFRDRSGEKPSPLGLLNRLQRMMPSNLALGGVMSARHWHPDFDLNGIPRLDLELHAPSGKLDLDFVQALDPALAREDDPTEPAILAVHPLVRAASMFSKVDGESFPWADPVETALDLYDLTLTRQANQMLTHLRPEVRLA